MRGWKKFSAEATLGRKMALAAGAPRRPLCRAGLGSLLIHGSILLTPLLLFLLTFFLSARGARSACVSTPHRQLGPARLFLQESSRGCPATVSPHDHEARGPLEAAVPWGLLFGARGWISPLLPGLEITRALPPLFRHVPFGQGQAG